MKSVEQIEIKGFKSIKCTSISPSGINVLIGANGSGKSNLISVFRFLSYIIASPSGSLQRYIAENGGASAILYGGPKRSREIEISITIRTERGRNEYRFRLFFAAGDTLLFADEACRFLPDGRSDGRWIELGAGQKEALIIDHSNKAATTTRNTIAGLLRDLIVYHFQDTSREARIKRRWPINDGNYLKFDGANIAPFLFSMRGSHPDYYRRIVETIRQIAPFFDDFVFEDEHNSMLLKWSERASDAVFSVEQASDGTLRSIALVTALMQPPSKLPALIVLDEPELGLHPYAINIVSGLIKSAGELRQILLATQSPTLLDTFDPESVIVVDRDAEGSHFRKMGTEDLEEWLSEYTLSDLWNRNIIGGRPKEVRS
ncbi:AAA family ATPase [Bosea sp. (in: a-proteobacteria)]|jgi:predicted ATPase|uniref:AAA family ATPase n=1 Tax=Bosea sp. (in: a-proteobacteria) TaxID=1871050 RepID=UPI00356390AE